MKMELPRIVGLAAWILSLMFLTCGETAFSANQATADPTASAPVFDGRFASAIVLDADTGEILLVKNPHLRRQPASMLKMMTELLVLEGIAGGEVSLQDTLTVSAHASKMGGSQVYLKHGERFTVEDLLRALAIHSANDAAVVLAEHMAGSTRAFVDLMNLRARELGMHDSVFHSVHGLPAGSGQQPDQTSAYDMALLGKHLVRYPMALRWSSTAKAPFRGGKFTMYNPNKLVGTFRGLDGLKTGYHDQAGFCVTATAIQKGKRLISVVMGARSDEARATETTRLLSHSFSLFTQVTLLEQGRIPLTRKLNVQGGKRKKVSLAYIGPLRISVRKEKAQEVFLEPRLPERIQAPIQEGKEVGKGIVFLHGQALGSVPIVTLEAVPKGNWFDRLFH